jgi:phytanoyl-CoA hydroxylase
MIDLQAYKENGYLLFKSFFDPREIALVHEEAREIFTTQMRRHGILTASDVKEEEFTQGMFALFETDLQAFMNCGKHAQHLISLHRLALDERIVTTLKELGLEFPSISTRPVMYFNSPRLATKEVYWRLSVHQDWRSIQGSLDSIVVWAPLIDIDRELGALEVIPRSHRRGLLPAELIDGYGHILEPVESADFVPIEIKKGDALFFSTFLIHRSGTNVTESIRWSCHFRYNNLRERTFIERGLPHPYIYQPQERLITEGFPDPAQVDQLFS